MAETLTIPRDATDAEVLALLEEEPLAPISGYVRMLRSPLAEQHHRPENASAWDDTVDCARRMLIGALIERGVYRNFAAQYAYACTRAIKAELAAGDDGE